MVYKLIEKNVPVPGSDTRVNKWYAKEVKMGFSTMRMMADAIALMCTVTRPDILSVLDAMVIVMRDRLQAGQVIELGSASGGAGGAGIGNFQLTLHNNGGSATYEAWTPALIKKAKVTYRPSVDMKDVAATTSFTRWSGDTAPEE
jgi:predicted histone-like DNA-binding protein